MSNESVTIDDNIFRYVPTEMVKQIQEKLAEVKSD